MPLDVNYYLRLITSQYQKSANMLAWLTANGAVYADIVACADSFSTAFDIDAAIGVQLDVLGTIVGQPRTMPFQPSNGVSPVLDDATYRLLIRARAMQNHWNGKISGLWTIWKRLFPGGFLLIQDHQDMTVSFYIGVGLTSILQDLIVQGMILPRPQCVLYNYTFATLPMLGFDRNDDYIAGFDVGHFV